MHQGALQVLREIVARLSQFSVDQQEVCRRCALGECTKASVPNNEHSAGEILEWIDRDPQAPNPQQDLVQGAVPQVVGGPSTGTVETPGDRLRHTGDKYQSSSKCRGTGHRAGYSGEYGQ